MSSDRTRPHAFEGLRTSAIRGSAGYNGPVALLAVMGLYSLLSGTAFAQDVIGSDRYYEEHLRGARDVTALGDDLFGDVVSLKDGDLMFVQDDVQVPTNSGLRLAFGRQTPRFPQGLDRDLMSMGAAWEINVPYMVARYDTRFGWTSGGSPARCSSADFTPKGTVGPAPDYNTRVMVPKLYWTGIHINIPGAGYESLLKLTPQGLRPNDGAKYVGATRNDWRVGCLASIRNGTGEGFVVRLPDGQRVYFDWMVVKDAPDVLANDSYQDDKGNGTAAPYLLVPTSDVYLYATRVEDRFGNYVLYDYDPARRHRLVGMRSNEGSRIDVGYGTNGKVATVRANGLTWTYRYVASPWGDSLSEIVQPDGSRWTFSSTGVDVRGQPYNKVMHWKLRPLRLPGAFYANSCQQSAVGYRSSDPEEPTHTNILVMRHPSGAVGEFKLRHLIHGSDNTPGGCGVFGTGQTNFWFGSYGIPNAYLGASLVSKKITGAGGVNQVWTYSYAPQWSFQRNCASGCTSTTVVKEPSGATRTLRFGNSYTDNLGDLLNEDVSEGGVTKSSVRYVRKGATGDFPESYGTPIAPDANPLLSKRRPVQLTEQVVDGRRFTRKVEAFDGLGRPLRVTEASSAP